MKRPAQHPAPLRRARVLLALTALLGLLAMHGLTGGTVGGADAAPAAVAAHTVPSADGGGTDGHHTDDCPCPHHDGGHGGAVHAGPMCLSAAPSAPWTPPAPAPAPLAAPPGPRAAPAGADPAALGGPRSPPDLAELQLLRI
ncbi:DUF6153 family protein [Streptacidiphilus sp. ASG 303]|uniref:DUF6153 family protein n=1 Tax=Streptacidiphilus sp. ASG 303 TaxID=2896847 RepID=UPI001E47E287|nr:DUF6153 family protein [Streptacidiphilus sp. ASG 303]MCD0484187.1 DUF6153 family protein [Streptacidiphilus sp. ASG 303]